MIIMIPIWFIFFWIFLLSLLAISIFLYIIFKSIIQIKFMAFIFPRRISDGNINNNNNDDDANKKIIIVIIIIIIIQ